MEFFETASLDVGFGVLEEIGVRGACLGVWVYGLWVKGCGLRV